MKASKEALNRGQIGAICRRALGDTARPLSVRRIHGGTVHAVYRLTLDGHPEVVLRIAPAPPREGMDWDLLDAMRREHSIQPSFAPIAHLLPSTLLVDFT